MLVICVEESGRGCGKNESHCCGGGFGGVAEFSVADAVLDPQSPDALVFAGQSLRFSQTGQIVGRNEAIRVSAGKGWRFP